MPLLQMLALMALGADAVQATEHASTDSLTAMLVEGDLASTDDEDFDVAELRPSPTTPRHAGFAWMVTQRQQDTPAPAAQLPDYSPESFRAARPYVSGSESEGDDGEGCDSAILPASNVFEDACV